MLTKDVLVVPVGASGPDWNVAFVSDWATVIVDPDGVTDMPLPAAIDRFPTSEFNEATTPETAETNGPTVVPFMRTNNPAEVTQMSPLFGAVGAEPGGTLSPAAEVVDGVVISGPVRTPPAKFSGV